MEPLNDRELDALLSEWQAPVPPNSLEANVLAKRKHRPVYEWLLRGKISVPVPVGLIITAILIVLSIAVMVRPETSARREHVTFANFKPLKHVGFRIIRSRYESK